MRFTFLVTLTLTIFASSGICQKISNIDFDNVCEQVNGNKNKGYYPSILAEFNKGDTNVFSGNYLLLYYGQTCQKKFDPYVTDEDKLFEFIMTQQYDKAEPLCKSIQEKNPVSLIGTYSLAMLYYSKKDHDNYYSWLFNFQKLLAAVLSSGTGENEETAIVVNSVQDEDVIIGFQGLKIEGRQDKGRYDVVQIASPNALNLEELYFDKFKIQERFKTMMEED